MGWGREGGTPGGGMVNRALLSCICFTKWSVPCLQTMKFLLQKLSKFVLEAAGKTVPSENITEKVARELPPNFPRKNLLVLGGGEMFQQSFLLPYSNWNTQARARGNRSIAVRTRYVQLWFVRFQFVLG